MLSHLLLTIALSLQAALPTEPVKAWIENHEVWIEKGDEARPVTYDGIAVEPVEASPEGEAVLYAATNPNSGQNCENGPSQYVVLVSASGRMRWKAALEEEPWHVFACRDFDRFDWIDQQRIGVMSCGHANCHYWILDRSSGKVLQQLGSGFDFLWSHNRKWVAHRRPAITPDDAGSLMFNDDNIVYPPADPTSRRLPIRDIGEMAWSPDDEWLSFGETEYPSGDSYVVLVNPSGMFLRESLPVDVDSGDKVQWTDNSHLQIMTSGRLFKFVVANDTLTEIVEH